MNGMTRVLGSPPSLEPKHWRMLKLLGVASFFEGYDLNVLLVSLPQMRASFGLSKSSASAWILVLYIGALPAIALARRADAIGRRRLLLFTLFGYLLATGATALTPTIATFVVCQFVARMFLTAENSVVWTVIAEELPPEARGYGFGWLALMSALGTGMCAILYGSVFSAFDWSWRGLYLVGLAPIAVVIPKGFGAAPVQFDRSIPSAPTFRLLADSADPDAPQVVSGLTSTHPAHLILTCCFTAAAALNH